MIKSLHCNTHEHFFTQLTDLDQVAGQINDPKHVFWLDLQQPTEQELAAIAATFLLALKKQFLTFRRIVTPERDVLNVLTNRDSTFFSEHIAIYFRDVYDHVTRLADTLDLYRDQLSTIMDANLSIVPNELNKVMRTLTAVSIILMLDALVVGIYGVNFVNMPELKWQYGYFAVLAFMAVISAMLMLYFKRLKWL